jgi:hypothetical protein
MLESQPRAMFRNRVRRPQRSRGWWPELNRVCELRADRALRELGYDKKGGLLLDAPSPLRANVHTRQGVASP